MALDDHGFVEPTGDAVSGSGGVVMGPLYSAFAVAAGLARPARAGSAAFHRPVVRRRV